MRIFDGRIHAEKLDENILRIARKSGESKKLGIILVGENPSSCKYVELKKKYCEKIRVPIEVFLIREKLTDDEIIKMASSIISKDYLTSVIVQLPLPRPNLNKILDLIPLEKDVDVLASESGRQTTDPGKSRRSPVIRACEYFLDSNMIKTEGLSVYIIGSGYLVGKPLEIYFKNRGAKVDTSNDYRTSDFINTGLLVLCAGAPNLVRGEMVSSGCHIIDFGFSILNGRTTGDLDMNSKLDHLGVISPSPGGMGPLVIRFLIMNHLGI